MPADSAPADASVRDAVAALLDGPAPAAVDRLPEGTNPVYRVARDDPGAADVVAKVVTRGSVDRIATAATVLRRVGATPGVPTPRFVGFDADPPGLDAPLLVTEAVDVEPIPPHGQGVPDAVVDQAVREAGRVLGRLHDAFAFDGVGALGLADGDLVVGDRFDDWPAVVDAITDRLFAGLADSRFADLHDPLDTWVADTAARVLADHRPTPVLVHGDYRWANLALDVDADPVTRAVFDWEAPLVGSAEYELALTECILVDRHGRPQGRREHLHGVLRDGYDETNVVPRGAAAERRRRLYRVMGRIRLMKELDEAVTGGAAARDERAADHRDAIARVTGVE